MTYSVMVYLDTNIFLDLIFLLFLFLFLFYFSFII